MANVILEFSRRSRRLWRRHRRRRAHWQSARHECSNVTSEQSVPRLKQQVNREERLAASERVTMTICDHEAGHQKQIATRTVIPECRRRRQAARRRRTRRRSELSSQMMEPAPSRLHTQSSSWLLSLLLLLINVGCPATMTSGQQQPLAAPSAASRDEYQLVGQAADQVHLPCMIGRQLYCGEPYFIAWYKLNLTSKSWVRIEHKSEEELASVGSGTGGDALNERVRFTWSRGASAGARSACEQARGANSAAGVGRLFEWSNFDCGQLTISRLELADEGQYKCEITFSESLDFDKCPATTLSQLSVIARPNEPELLVNGRPVVAALAGAALATATLGPLLTFKEGAQVRLECQSSGGRPAPRIEWLNVSQPQLEQAAAELEQAGDIGANNELTELAANRDSSAGAARQRVPTAPEVQLMRAHWPTQKKATLAQAASETTGAGGLPAGLVASASSLQQQQPTPITSSSVTISLSRYDLNSQFVCLVLPAASAPQQQNHNQQQQLYTGSSAAAAHEQLIKSPAYLRALLIQHEQQQQQRRTIPGTAPMLKWIKLNVQVKPSRVSVIVRDVETNATLQPVQQPQMPIGSFAAGNAFVERQMSPFYSLQLNRLYAIQCVADNSRPRSHVTWFNRTAPIGLAQVQLNNSDGDDYLLPSDFSRHRLTSYTRTTEHANGTFRTTATLLLTTNVWDNFEELFCRISNEAFQFDELSQVAPIVSARLYVNYPPIVWLEAEGAKWTDSGQVGRLKVGQNDELKLRCSVAANPLSQNTILQIEWLKDGRKLVDSGAQNSKHPQSSHQQQQQLRAASSRIQIEKANHLHMPLSQLTELSASAAAPTLTAASTSSSSSSSSSPSLTSRHIKSMLGNQLVASSKLIGASSLTISGLTKADSGAYTCHHKLIPAPSSAQVSPQAAATSQHHQQQQQVRITSGQANQTIQVNVIEAKPRTPTLRVSSSKGLLVYGLGLPPGGDLEATKQQEPLKHHQHQQSRDSAGAQSPWPTALVEPGAEVSLKCDLPQPAAFIQQQERSVSHKVMWYLDGAFIHSSGSSDAYNFTVGSTNSELANGKQRQQLGTFSCAHQVLAGSSGGAGQVAADNFHGSLMRLFQSSNQIDLKSKVKPKMLEKRELAPAVRSFSELELSANSASKLKLVCLAQCEPICSIDWYLNERPLAPLAAATASPANGEGQRATDDESQHGQSGFARRLWLSAAASSESSIGDNSASMMLANQPLSIYKQACEFPLPNSLGLAATPTPATLALLENVIYRKNESKFTWTRESSLNVDARTGGRIGGGGWQSPSELSSLPPVSPSEAAAFERASWQLRREASDQLSSNDANVFSKLELTYYQIAQLLLGPIGIASGAERGISFSDSNDTAAQFGDGRPLLIKCKLNKVLNGGQLSSLPFAANGRTSGGNGENNNNGAPAFGHARIERGRWFPEAAGGGGNSGADKDDDHRYQLAMSNGPLYLATLFAADDEGSDFAAVGNADAPTTANSNNDGAMNTKHPEIDNESRQLQRKQQSSSYSSSQSAWTDLHDSGRAISSPASKQQLGFGKASRQQNGDSSFVDEMQIRILLDRAPKSASLTFSGPVSSDGGAGRVSLTESQLLELADPNKPAPLLRCRAGGYPYPEPKFKWTFTDLNRTQHSIADADSSELNLRQFIEFRQRQLNVDPTSAYGVDVVANIVGNYTCAATNVHGSKSATLTFQIQGRPLCKLALGNEYLGAENELMANLRCTIYSAPPVLETVWFRNNQQLVANKSSLDTLSWSTREPLSVVELPVMVLSKQQDFMLSDLMTQMANFKCIARNPHGYSEACYLNQADKQTMLNTFKPMSRLGAKSPAFSMISYPTDNKLGMSPVMNYISNGSSSSIVDSSPGSQPILSTMRNLFARLDWLLITGCSLIFIWLLFVIGSSIVRRRCFDARKLRTKDASGNNNTSWRFNTTRANSNQETDGPFQSKICVNYYGGSNGDSEHDMIQSCNSQSSHYEEFAQQQQRLMLNQQQPLYFHQANHHSTLSRRPLKSSLSTSSTGDSSTGSRHGQQQQQMARLGELPQTNRPITAVTMRSDTHFSSHYSQTNHLAATMRESLANNRLPSCGTNVPSAGGGLTLTSNVPLINGTHNSRINLDQQQQQTKQQHYQRFNRDQHTFNGSQIRNNEHIYDDIIYNQIIL